MSEQLLDQELLNVTVFVDGEVAPIFPESGRLVIRESMERLVTTAELRFTDLQTAFTAEFPFVQDSEIKISLQDDDYFKNIIFRPFSENPIQQGSSDTFRYKLDLISVYADTVLIFKEFHSKRCKASDYIKYLAVKLGLTFDVEESKGVKDWINPNWKVGQLLRYLATTSVSKTGSSGYMYYITYDGKLVFKTVDKFFDDTSNPEIINLEYGTEVNQTAEIKRNLFSSVLFGANYKELSYYDLSNSEYVIKKMNYNKNLKKRALKFSVPIKYAESGRETFSSIFYSSDGTPLDYEKELFKKVLIFLDTNIIVATVKANPFGRKLGDVVNINIPINRDIGINVPMSGRYLIKTIVTKGIREYYQTLVLVRPGVNLREKNNLL